MAASIDRLKAQLEKAEAARKKAVRQTQLLTTKLGKRERRDDTRRKILIGSWAADKANRVPEFYADMHRELSRVWLVRDDDRALFGLEPLSDAEKDARGLVTGKATPKKATAAENSAVASGTSSGSAADVTAPPSADRETEPA